MNYSWKLTRAIKLVNSICHNINISYVKLFMSVPDIMSVNSIHNNTKFSINIHDGKILINIHEVH